LIPIQSDPEIQFSKIFCPVCGEPTGPKSTCHLSEEAQKTPASSKRVTDTRNGNMLSILSLHCFFRKKNMWEANTNNPVSVALLEELQRIPGINALSPTATYTFQFEVGPLFDELMVKRAITATYRHFIKSRAARPGPIIDNSLIDSIGQYTPSGVE